MSQEESPIFGIDLGTTCSAIGWVEGGRPVILKVQGEELLPSVVSFPPEGEPLVGRPALNRLVLDPQATIRSAKRRMGSNLRWVIGERSVSPVDVSAIILRELATAAGQAAGCTARRVVITVPAWFTQAQRADTRKAGEQAGLEVLRLVNEPTAAALAHAHGQELQRTALVYDLGGGTFDVSLVRQDGPVVEVLASHGDDQLGGDDFDRLLCEHVLQGLEFDDPALSSAVRADPGAMSRLSTAVEQVKIELSSATNAPLRVPFLLELEGQPRHLSQTVERGEIEELIAPLLERTLDSVERVLRDGKLRPGEVDELLLVGGSTRIPMVWELLRARYGIEGSAAIPPDRAVVLGAAIQAAIVGGSRVDGVLVDVAPFSLSVAALQMSTPGAPPCFLCRVVTPRNAPLPSRHTERFYTMGRFQPAIEIPVFQGGHPNPLANSVLGEIKVEDLAPAPEGFEMKPIDVEFRHDLDGMVDIRVIDVAEGREVSGRLAADGAQVEQLREEIIENMRLEGYTPGDGSDPDPWNPVAAGHHPEPVAAVHEEPGAQDDDDFPELDSVEEAQQLFGAVRRRQRTLQKQHPAEAEELLEGARRGLELLEQGSEADALALYEDLADRLFDLGIYL